MFGNFGKLFGKVDAVFTLLGGLGKDMADVKATIAVIERDIADAKAVLAEVKGITGHTATAVTVATTATPASVVAAAAPSAPDAPASLQSQLKADVAGVNPMAGVKLP